MSEVCNHSEADKDTAIFDGLCPLCLVERIHELEEANRWIPVRERLPKDDNDVLVWRERYREEWIASHDVTGWHTGDDDLFEITHWRPLLEPPTA
jgi:hypothetical protein